MVDKTKQAELGKLTAYERWELPNIGAKAPDKRLASSAPQKIKPLTAEDIEKIRQDAYDAGFQEGRKAGFEQGNNEGLALGKETGFKDGQAQGLAAGQEQIDQTISKLDTMLSELVAPLDKQQSLIEEAMLNVAMAVARTVIHRELSLDSSSIKTAIHSILIELPKVDKGFTLFIHPQDEMHVKPILDNYDAAISLKLDTSMTPGGCKVSTSTQLIDYTIEKRFQKTVQSMLAEAAKAHSEEQSIEVPSSIESLSDYPSETLSEHEQLSDQSVSSEHSLSEQSLSEQSLPPEHSSASFQETEVALDLDQEKTAAEQGGDLQGVDLQGTNSQGTDLQGGDVQDADKQTNEQQDGEPHHG